MTLHKKQFDAKKKKVWYRRPGLWVIVILVVLLIWAGHWIYHIYNYELPSIEEVYNIEPPLKTKTALC